MALNNLRLAALAKSPVPGKHADEQGLYLKVTPQGGMYWQWRVRTPRETIVSYGTYPEVGLAEARERHAQARAQRRAGLDPNLEKRKAKFALMQRLDSTNTFEAIAREWYSVRKGEWAEGHAKRVLGRLEQDAFPRIGRMPIADIMPTMVLDMARKVEARGVYETTWRVLKICSQVFRYAVVTQRCPTDPTVGLTEALKAPPPVQHMAAITDPKRLGELLRAIDGYKGSRVVHAALKLAPMLLLRPTELRCGAGAEIDLGGALWTIPPSRMKRRRDGKANGDPHLVPLPHQAVAILRELLEGQSDQRGWLFPSQRKNGRPMSENTINAALRTLGFDTSADQTGHGFRATARTLLAEELGFDVDVIETQLAHRVRDSLGRAYNRAQYLAQRRAMLQAWADYLDRLRAGETPAYTNVVPMQRAAFA